MGIVVLLAVWSPKGGSGVTVVAAGLAVTLSRSRHPAGARLADLAGDAAALFGVAVEPATGLADWLAQGVEAPTDALDRIAVSLTPSLRLLPRGGDDGPLPGDDATGAALAVALDGVPTILDAGVARDPAARAAVRTADVSIVVVRACYLALRRAVRDDLLPSCAGVVVIEETGRAIPAPEVAQVLGRPLLARVPVTVSVARAVDAGLYGQRLPGPLKRPFARVLEVTGLLPGIDTDAAA